MTWTVRTPAAHGGVAHSCGGDGRIVDSALLALLEDDQDYNPDAAATTATTPAAVPTSDAQEVRESQILTGSHTRDLFWQWTSIGAV